MAGQVVATGRVVIIGAGIAALYAALRLAPRPVVVISPERLGEGASSGWAQGGVAAAMAAPDSPALHAEDTCRAGAGLVDAEVARHVAGTARHHAEALAALGTPFDRAADGTFALSREAAHSLARILRVGGDGTGRAIMHTLVAAVRGCASVQVLEGVQALGLESDGARVRGVHLGAADSGATALILRAPAVLVAGGGSAGLYARTTNPPRIRGQVIGMAARAGAEIADAEFVQFHPTAIDTGEDPTPLATEALRGEGAVLLNARGERFMPGLHPDAELAPRDVVARAVFAEARAGRRPVLDTRKAIGAEIDARFPAVAGACRRAGIDPVREPIPVTAAAHYHMGGIATALTGRSSLEGLWACGEAAATGLHGANRLASNGLLEALVFADAAAADIAAQVALTPERTPEVPAPKATGEAAHRDALIARLRAVMSAEVGVLRDGAGLCRALAEITAIETAAGEDDPALCNMTAAATLIAAAALAREESRGGHFRTDFPEPLAECATRRSLTLVQARAIRDAALADLAHPPDPQTEPQP